MLDHLVSSIDLAAAAHAKGKALPVPRVPNMERRQGALYVAELSRNLSDEEMDRLAEATSLREQALEKAREGELERARLLLTEAHDFIGTHLSSPEARTSACSYYAAAAAFVEFSEGNLQTAFELLSEALLLCRQLHSDYGHSVEVRRVHLSRNIVRIVWRMGRHVEAWQLCLGLLNYVWGQEARWPLDEETAIAVPDREILRIDERVFLTDQLLSEAISTAADAGRHVAALNPALKVLSGWKAEAPSDRINRIGRLCQSLSDDGRDSALQWLVHCFEQGEGPLPMSWHRMERLFQEISATRLPA
jgi:tetratricopeptide (TPR) repeat protein